MKKIFVIGLTSSALGGMEYHNLGNYAIMEPLIVYLKKEFPNVEISTSIQMSDEFCKKFNIESKCEERFWTYGKQTAIITAIDILKISLWSFFKYVFHLNLEFILKSSVMLNELYKADLVMDFSGDIYGDNTGFNGFLEASAEILLAKVLDKPVVMFVGSPGPFRSTWRKRLAKFVFNRVNLITNREPLSTELLIDLGVNPNHMKTTACPAFLFEPKKRKEVQSILEKENIISENKKPLVGIILCGWNMPKPSYYKIPKGEDGLQPFVQLVKHLIENLNVRVLLMSHQNRTDENGNSIQGNDHKIIRQLYEILEIKSYGDDLFTLKGLYDAAISKTIIGYCDMLISGRIHGAVAGLSQCIPTVIIDYGHEPKAHKLRGFARLVGVESYVCDPTNAQDMIEKVSSAWENRDEIRKYLKKRIPEVKELAKSNFKLLQWALLN
jgi:colanic acid/amylovoran biosynthesis protein